MSLTLSLTLRLTLSLTLCFTLWMKEKENKIEKSTRQGRNQRRRKSADFQNDRTQHEERQHKNSSRFSFCCCKGSQAKSSLPPQSREQKQLISSSSRRTERIESLLETSHTTSKGMLLTLSLTINLCFIAFHQWDKRKGKKRVSRLWVLFYSTLDFSVPCLLSLKKSQKKEEHNTKLKNSSFWMTDSVM